MNKITLKFHNRELERKFQDRETRESTIGQICLVYFISGIYFALGSLGGVKSNFKNMAACLCLAGFLLLMNQIRAPERREILLVFISVSSSGLSLFVNLFDQQIDNDFYTITYQMTLLSFSSTNFLINISCYTLFFITRVIISYQGDFEAYRLLFLLSTTAVIVKNYGRIYELRQVFLQAELNDCYSDLTDFLTKDAIITATFDQHYQKFLDFFRNSTAKVNYYQEANELFKSLYVEKGKTSLATFLYRNVLQKGIKKYHNTLDGIQINTRTKLTIHIMVKTVHETHFIVKLTKMVQAYYRHSPNYAKLLGQVKNLEFKETNKLVKQHYFFNLIQSLKSARLCLNAKELHLTKLHQFAKFSQFEATNIVSIITDARYIYLLLEIIRPKSIAFCKNLNGDFVHVNICRKTPLNQKKISLINLIISSIGVGQLKSDGSLNQYNSLKPLVSPQLLNQCNDVFKSSDPIRLYKYSFNLLSNLQELSKFRNCDAND